MITIEIIKQFIDSPYCPKKENSQLLRNIDRLHELYRQLDEYEGMVAQHKYKTALARLNKIQAEYKSQEDQRWLDFAHKCWPEIDEYFDFSASCKKPTYDDKSDCDENNKWPDGDAPSWACQ